MRADREVERGRRSGQILGRSRGCGKTHEVLLERQEKTRGSDDDESGAEAREQGVVGRSIGVNSAGGTVG